jgi:hypothetical protein
MSQLLQDGSRPEKRNYFYNRQFLRNIARIPLTVVRTQQKEYKTFAPLIHPINSDVCVTENVRQYFLIPLSIARPAVTTARTAHRSIAQLQYKTRD